MLNFIPPIYHAFYHGLITLNIIENIGLLEEVYSKLTFQKIIMIITMNQQGYLSHFYGKLARQNKSQNKLTACPLFCNYL